MAKKKATKRATAAAVAGAAHGSALDRNLMHALKTDGAIRVIDGRWSLGFVDENALKDAIQKGMLRTQKRHGMTFAVLPNDKDQATRGA